MPFFSSSQPVRLFCSSLLPNAIASGRIAIRSGASAHVLSAWSVRAQNSSRARMPGSVCVLSAHLCGITRFPAFSAGSVGSLFERRYLAEGVITNTQNRDTTGISRVPLRTLSLPGPDGFFITPPVRRIGEVFHPVGRPVIDPWRRSICLLIEANEYSKGSRDLRWRETIFN